jgi:hypothetical protein
MLDRKRRRREKRDSVGIALEEEKSLPLLLDVCSHPEEEKKEGNSVKEEE